MRVPFTFELPTGTAYPENPIVAGWSNINRFVPAFGATGTSNWFGRVTIVADYPISAPIRIRLVANGTGNVRLDMGVQKSNASAASDVAHTTITAQTIALSGTAKTIVTGTFLMPFTVGLADTLSFRLTRYADDALDTAAVPLLIWDAHLSDV